MIDLSQRLSVFTQAYGDIHQDDWQPRAIHATQPRYLWTDAYAVCFLLTCFDETQDSLYLTRAQHLVDQVHQTLGFTRDGKARLSGASEAHPTLGGLRIGKVDEEGTSDGDGQYFHYLTKWMFALGRLYEATQARHYFTWAHELAEAIFPHFVYATDGGHRMHWKISIDMQTPAVPTQGNLDPYDGLATYRYLQSLSGATILTQETATFSDMVVQSYQGFSTSDPLDLGEALWLSHFHPEDDWSQIMQARCLEALERLWQQGYFEQPQSQRIAFREFGLVLGITVHPYINDTWRARAQALLQTWLEGDMLVRDHDITPTMFAAIASPGVLRA